MHAIPQIVLHILLYKSGPKNDILQGTYNIFDKGQRIGDIKGKAANWL
jgi:hypothetical protein